MNKRLIAFLSIFSLFLSLPLTPVNAATKAGGACKKVGLKSVVSNKSFTCIKSGKKLVWNKGVLIVKSAPKVVDLTFNNLFENRKDISYTVWKRTSDSIKVNKSKAGNISIFTGPNTKPYYDDYPKAISQVSRIFPNDLEAKEILVIRYNFKDLDWAENTAKVELPPADYKQLVSNARGPISLGNCDSLTANCRGSRQLTPSSGVAVILQGVENTLNQEFNGKLVFTTGMLEAHEYFHSLQRIPIMDRGIEAWPHAWFREGSAELVQNLAISFDNYAKYKKFLIDDCYYTCRSMTSSQFEEFLNTAKEEFVPAKFDAWLNYALGSHVIEILAAVKGSDILIDMYEEMGNGLKFDEAFAKIFGIAWKDAIPIIAKTIHANLQEL
jgi:hypothetical protein